MTFRTKFIQHTSSNCAKFLRFCIWVRHYINFQHQVPLRLETSFHLRLSSWTWQPCALSTIFLSHSIKLLISATLSTSPPAPKVFSFPKQFCISFVCKHCVFIQIVVWLHFIFSNKVDLSQRRSVVIPRKRLNWNSK